MESENLYKFINETLIAKGHSDPNKWSIGLPENINELPFIIQKQIINHHLRMLFGGLSIDTKDVRYCIIDEATFDEWTDLFVKMMAPFMVTNNI